MDSSIERGRYGAQFVAELYRILFGREPDPTGFEYYVSSLSSGLQPHELVARFIESNEFTSRWRQKVLPHLELPDLRSILPTYYEDDLYLAEDDSRVELMETLISKHHYYDNSGVWGSIIDNDKMIMAQLVQCTGAKSCLEVGCFNGPILSVLDERGLEVTGVDLSHLAFIIAFPNIRTKLIYGDLLYVTLDRKYDCILLLDVMEHLNPLRLSRYLQRIRELLEPNGLVIVNSPMFGNDPVFGTVFQQYLPQWREVGARSFFRHWPCDPKGWPMHGHMIWASPQWWTRQFESFDLVRQTSVEQVIQDKLARYFEESPARKSLVVLGHREGLVNTDGIYAKISQQSWQ